MELPNRSERDWLTAFGVAAIFIAWSPANTRCAIGATQNLGKALAAQRRSIGRDAQLASVWWVSSLEAALELARAGGGGGHSVPDPYARLRRSRRSGRAPDPRSRTPKPDPARRARFHAPACPRRPGPARPRARPRERDRDAELLQFPIQILPPQGSGRRTAVPILRHGAFAVEKRDRPTHRRGRQRHAHARGHRRCRATTKMKRAGN